MKTATIVLALALFAMATAEVRAGSTIMEDVATLAQKGIGEEVLLATVESSSESFNLSAADILRLKENKVPEKVILAMIRHKPALAQHSAPAPKTEQPATPSVPLLRDPRINYAMERDPQIGEGTLVIQNLDDRSWSYKYEPDAMTIWITKDRGSKLSARDGVSLRMRAGTYKIRYEGAGEERAVTVHNGEKSELLLTRVNSNELEALYVSVYERGEKKESGRLATLRENRSRLDDEDARYSNGNGNGTRERVIERERYVEVPAATTVVYGGSYYPSYGYGYYPRYYSYGCYPSYSYGCYPRYSHYGYGSRYGGYGCYGSGYSGFGIGFGYSSGRYSGRYSGNYSRPSYGFSGYSSGGRSGFGGSYRRR